MALGKTSRGKKQRYLKENAEGANPKQQGLKTEKQELQVPLQV